MKLAQFYQTIAPFLEGQADHAATVRALYGEQGGRDAARLEIYGRFCRVHRFEAVDKVYAETRAAVIARRGEPAWDALVEAYFVARPMHHWELNENGDELAAFVKARAAAEGLPAWLAELAELEWWEWRTLVAQDHAQDASPAQGALRLASTVELRPFAHDLCEWLDADERAAAPEAAQTIVLFWRDLELQARRGNTTPDELALLKAVHEGTPVDPQGPLAETLEDLRAAGILLGAR